MKTLFIAWLTIREAGRRKLLWAGLGLGTVRLLMGSRSTLAQVRHLRAIFKFFHGVGWRWRGRPWGFVFAMAM